ncbi:MAG: AAC(3) family N-acetyltransferase [Ignavibacteriaceae bacterium]|nr:AAC(3) family N-acetyltransferase [Ignavibacteriaceae bacterium]
MLEKFFREIGLTKGVHVIIHASFKKIHSVWRVNTPKEFLSALMNFIGENGSIMIPAFTYNFKKKDGTHPFFDKMNSISQTGILSQEFGKMPGVIRTSSQTHSFYLWGACQEISEFNNPKSPLGAHSPLEWLLKNDGTALLVGTDFTSFSFIHYLEIYFNLPWVNEFCWDENNVLPVGVTEDYETPLVEVPGCSKGFNNITNYLLNNRLIAITKYNGLDYHSIRLREFLQLTEGFFKNNFQNLLCNDTSCKCCQSRRQKLKMKVI